MLMKPPAPARRGPNFETLRLPDFVGLGEAEEGEVEAAAVVEVELVRLIDNRLGVGGRAEVQTRCRYAADHAGLGSQRHEVDDALFRGHGRDAFRHADAEVDDRARLQLECRPSRDDFALAHLHRLQGRHRHPHLAGESRAVRLRECLHVVFGLLRHHNAIDQDAGNFHLPRIEGAAVGDPLDLDYDEAARVARGHRDGERLQRQRFAFHGDVAVEVGGGAAHDRDVDREGFVEKVLLAIQLHDPDEVGGGAVVDLAAAVAWIGKCAETDAREVPRLAGCDVAVKVRDDALRQVVGFDVPADCQFLQLRHETPMAADDAGYQPLVPEVVEAAFLAVALAGRIDERQVTRFGVFERAIVAAGNKAFFKRDGDVFGKTDADETAGGDGIAGSDQCHGITGGNGLAAGRSLQRLQARNPVARHHPSQGSRVNWGCLTRVERMTIVQGSVSPTVSWR